MNVTEFFGQWLTDASYILHNHISVPVCNPREYKITNNCAHTNPEFPENTTNASHYNTQNTWKIEYGLEPPQIVLQGTCNRASISLGPAGIARDSAITCGDDDAGLFYDFLGEGQTTYGFQSTNATGCAVETYPMPGWTAESAHLYPLRW